MGKPTKKLWICKREKKNTTCEKKENKYAMKIIKNAAKANISPPHKIWGGFD